MRQMRRTLTSTIQLLFLLVLFSISAQAQNWSTFLDPSRAIDWSSAGFTVPNYTVNCSTQPSLTAGSGAASANHTAIQNALNSCDATHNVVNIPAGTWYVAGITITKSNVVLRGAGANSTILIMTAAGCGGSEEAGICMEDLNDGLHVYNGSGQVLPPSGTQQCLWSGTNGVAGTYTKGATSLNLTNCGGVPVNNHFIILDQADDTSDTSGVYICQANATSDCGYEGINGGSGNMPGRVISGLSHSQQQVAFVTAVSGSSGTYNVTISPGVAFSNVRTGQAAGVWWGGQISNVGVENLTNTPNTGSGFGPQAYNFNMYDCYHCWIKGVRSEWAGRGHIMVMQTGFDTIRDNYFYQSQNHASQSYVVEFEAASGVLVENSIFQQVTNPLMFGSAVGNVVGYNYAVDDVWTGGGPYLFGPFSVHNAGSEMNLWEGNSFPSIEADDAFGSSTQQTYFRNMLQGWQSGATYSTWAVMNRRGNRIWNIVGNVLGQPNYHTQYQAYATSSSAGVGAASEDTSIYSLGWGGTGAACSPACDPLVFFTLMRWGNWDVVNAAVQWNATEASPTAVPYVSANFTSSYFSSLAHTFPNSLYYSSKPSWWPAGVAWPPIGPDVSSGNVGTCSGTYSGSQATSSSQCTGGTLSTAWASHVNAIPAQVCYLSQMSGPPDGSGSVLSFDASLCYASSGTSGSGPAPPTGLTAAVN
jgi:hypothetical protein